MPNISLDNSYSSPVKLEELKNIFQCKADATINKIRFEKWKKLRPIDGTNLADLLKNATSVTLSNTVVDGDLYKFFQNLPSIRVDFMAKFRNRWSTSSERKLAVEKLSKTQAFHLAFKSRAGCYHRNDHVFRTE